MFGLSRWFYLWVFAGSLWGPFAWLLFYGLDFVEFSACLGGRFFFRGSILFPALMFWWAASLIHMSLWACARRASIVAVMWGIVSIGASAVTIGFLSWFDGICMDGSGLPCASCGGEETAKAAVELSILVLGTSLPAWITAVACEVVHTVRQREDG